MRTHYLIDYENKNDAGLSGIKNLHPEDVVYIFFSQNACKLDMNAIAGTRAFLQAVKVQPGKQSLDMHLVSYLGFLLRENGNEDLYVVISDDTDFDKVIAFWCQNGYSVERRKTIDRLPELMAAPEKKKTARKTRTSRKNGKTASDEKTASAAETAAAADVTEADKTEVIPEVPAEKTEPEVTAEPETAETSAETGTENPSEIPGTAEEKTAAVSEETVTPDPAVPEAESDGTAAEEKSAARTGRKRKPAGEKQTRQEKTEKTPQAAAGKAVQAGAVKPSEITQINSRVQKLLAQNKLKGPDINAIASLVSSCFDKKDRKSLIYRGIIKKYGQKNGLLYYNMLKSEI